MLRFSAREHLLLHKGPSEYINNGSEEEEDCNADIINTQFAEGLTDTLYILWKEFIMTFKKKKPSPIHCNGFLQKLKLT